ncbi:MAG TPA: cell division protein FtsZ [Ktedonobacterales bacterium]|nr:cell division protein FtsZ [Ktedonobacterales bacterium]
MQPVERDEQRQDQHDSGQNVSGQDAASHPVLPRQIGCARLQVVGIGGAGTNAVNRMIAAGVSGVEFIAMNTDHQSLDTSRAPRRLRLGETTTRGLGAGGNPEVGRRAAEESYEGIRETVDGADMVFIAAGMGGGTGTGGAPLLAQAAREAGAVTVAVVTTPFGFERRRKLVAQQGLLALRDTVDALIAVPNERLAELGGRDMSLLDAYSLADDVLRQGVQGISDLITIPGLVNLDFADVRGVMADAGSALIATGRAEGEGRAEAAARQALSNPLLDVDISGARGVIFNVTGGDDLTLREVETIADIIGSAAHPDANLVYGTVNDATLAGSLRVTVVATGFEPRVRHERAYTVTAATPSRTPPLRVSRPASLDRGEHSTSAVGVFASPPGTSGHSTPAYPAHGRDTADTSQTPGVPAVPPAPARHGGTDTALTITPVARPAARPVSSAPRPAANGEDQDGARGARPRADYAIRPPARGSRSRSPGYHGDEFVAADEQEDDVAQRPAPRQWGFFGHHRPSP